MNSASHPFSFHRHQSSLRKRPACLFKLLYHPLLFTVSSFPKQTNQTQVSSCDSLYLSPFSLSICLSFLSGCFPHLPGGKGGGGQRESLSWTGSKRPYWMSFGWAQRWWALRWRLVRSLSRCVLTSASVTRCCRWLWWERERERERVWGERE